MEKEEHPNFERTEELGTLSMTELTDLVKALSEVQRNSKIHVNRELVQVLNEVRARLSIG